MKEIKLTKGYTALVDDEDFDELSKYKWQAQIRPRAIYVQRGYWDSKQKKQIIVFIHRQIMRCPKGLVVDHINHNGLDNRKENLRICTLSQNRQNTRKTKPNKYGYKGICFIKKNKTKPYQAQLHYGNKIISLGAYSTPEEAACAYDKKARELFGEYAYLNFN